MTLHNYQKKLSTCSPQSEGHMSHALKMGKMEFNLDLKWSKDLKKELRSILKLNYENKS